MAKGTNYPTQKPLNSTDMLKYGKRHLLARSMPRSRNSKRWIHGFPLVWIGEHLLVLLVALQVHHGRLPRWGHWHLLCGHLLLHGKEVWIHSRGGCLSLHHRGHLVLQLSLPLNQLVHQVLHLLVSDVGRCLWFRHGLAHFDSCLLQPLCRVLVLDAVLRSFGHRSRVVLGVCLEVELRFAKGAPFLAAVLVGPLCHKPLGLLTGNWCDQHRHL